VVQRNFVCVRNDAKDTPLIGYATMDRGIKMMISYVAPIVAFVSVHPQWAYAALFLLALSEAIPLVGTVVPGSTLIIGISTLAVEASVRSWLLVVAAAAGAIVGDGVAFWLGRRYQREILSLWPLNRYPQFIARSEMFIRKYGAMSVFIARFAAVVRAFVPLVAGILGMSPLWFYAANMLSALVWAPVHVFSGVLLGSVIRFVSAGAELHIVLLMVGVIVFLTGVWLLRFRFNRGTALVQPAFQTKQKGGG
jgi:membrane protein DedA with SNARE-associated domain